MDVQGFVLPEAVREILWILREEIESGLTPVLVAQDGWGRIVDVVTSGPDAETDQWLNDDAGEAMMPDEPTNGPADDMPTRSLPPPSTRTTMSPRLFFPFRRGLNRSRSQKKNEFEQTDRQLPFFPPSPRSSENVIEGRYGPAPSIQSSHEKDLGMTVAFYSPSGVSSSGLLVKIMADGRPENAKWALALVDYLKRNWSTLHSGESLDVVIERAEPLEIRPGKLRVHMLRRRPERPATDKLNEDEKRDQWFRYYFLCKRGIYQPPLIRITHGQMAKELNIAPGTCRTAYAQWLAVMDDKQIVRDFHLAVSGLGGTYISTESTKEMIPNRR